MFFPKAKCNPLAHDGKRVEFGRNSLEGIPKFPNRLMAVKLVFGYEVPKTYVRRIEKEGVLSKERMRYIKNKN